MKRPWEKISKREWLDWRWQMGNQIRTLSRLARFLGIQVNQLADLRPVVENHPMLITPYYGSLVNPGESADPVGRQCVPDVRELEHLPGDSDDPLGETSKSPVPGLLHRYPDRCLVLATSRCATHCRHCNRRRLWNQPAFSLSPRRIQALVEYIASNGDIREVILSGGDPLILGDEVIDGLLDAFRSVPHVEVIRIGSRVPVVLPMRITAGLCRVLKKHRPLWFMTQFNHPRELTPEAARACERLLEAGIPVSNQSVLLRGINDSFGTMRELVHGLQRISVRPYYLFQCEPVKGTAHFRVDPARGMDISEKLWGTTAGICLPRYVVDRPDSPGKVPLQRFPGHPVS